MPDSTIVYDFEQAESLEELKTKATLRVADGWLVSSDPRMIEIRVSPSVVQRRYSQTFHRYARAGDPELTRSPWEAVAKERTRSRPPSSTSS